jgi:hypothetical protein
MLRSPTLRRWSQHPLGALLALLLLGFAFFGLYETRPEGTSLLEWITSSLHLGGMVILLFVLLSLPLVALALFAIACVAWGGVRLLSWPLRRLWPEGPSLPPFRSEQELIEQTHRDLELGRRVGRVSKRSTDRR